MVGILLVGERFPLHLPVAVNFHLDIMLLSIKSKMGLGTWINAWGQSTDSKFHCHLWEGAEGKTFASLLLMYVVVSTRCTCFRMVFWQIWWRWGRMKLVKWEDGREWRVKSKEWKSSTQGSDCCLGVTLDKSTLNLHLNLTILLPLHPAATPPHTHTRTKQWQPPPLWMASPCL